MDTFERREAGDFYLDDLILMNGMTDLDKETRK